MEEQDCASKGCALLPLRENRFISAFLLQMEKVAKGRMRQGWGEATLLAILGHLVHFCRIAHVSYQRCAVGAGIFFLNLIVKTTAEAVGSLLTKLGFRIVKAGAEKLQFVRGKAGFLPIVVRRKRVLAVCRRR